jgi:hypothetical protein
MEFVPSDDAFKNAINPPKIDGAPASVCYVIQKTMSADVKNPKAPQLNLFKIGFSRLSRGGTRLLEARTFLLSYKINRLYLYVEKDFMDKTKQITDAYANDAEVRLHSWVLGHFKFPIARMEFPGSVPGRPSLSEYFDVPKNKQEDFLKGIDQYLYNQVVPAPMWGTKFTATTATKINMPRQVAAGVGVYYLGPDPKKKETFRKSKSKYARSLASEKALVLAKKRDAERKKQLAADKKDAQGSVAFWKGVFVGKTFKDPDLGPHQYKFVDVLKNVRDVFQDDYNDKARKIPSQMAIVYEPVPPSRRTRTWNQERIDAESGTLSVHESLIALKLQKKYKKQFDYYVRLNGYSSTIDYAAANEDIAYEELTGNGLRQWRHTHGSQQPPPPAAVFTISQPPPIVVMRDRRPVFRSDPPLLMLLGGGMPPSPPRTPLPIFKQPRRSETTTPLTANEKQIRQFRRTLPNC